MLLTYLGPTKERSPHCAGVHLPFKIGDAYDVAEIFEYPGFLMVRDANSLDWPAPGDAGFGIDPWLFASCSRQIDICARGYEFHTKWVGEIGCLVRVPDDILKLRQAVVSLDDVDQNRDGESFDRWFLRNPGLRTYEPLARFLYDIWAEGAAEPEVIIYDDVVSSCSQIAAIIYQCKSLVLRDVSRIKAMGYVARYLGAIGLSKYESQIGILDHTFWRGDGSPRLINRAANFVA